MTDWETVHFEDLSIEKLTGLLAWIHEQQDEDGLVLTVNDTAWKIQVDRLDAEAGRGGD